MKKILSLCLASGLLCALSAFAAIGGNWHGTGTLNMTGAPGMNCESVLADIGEDGSGLDIRKFDYNCSGVEMQASPLRLEQRGDAYFLGGQQVGRTDGTVSEITLTDPSGATMQFHFERVGAELKVKHTLAANGFSQTMEATLQQ